MVFPHFKGMYAQKWWRTTNPHHHYSYLGYFMENILRLLSWNIYDFFFICINLNQYMSYLNVEIHIHLIQHTFTEHFLRISHWRVPCYFGPLWSPVSLPQIPLILQVPVWVPFTRRKVQHNNEECRPWDQKDWGKNPSTSC